MRKITKFTFMVLAVCLIFTGVFGQDAARTELDASSLRSGEPMRFNVRVDSLESLSFAEARTRLTAILCPAGAESGSCQIMNMSPDGDDSISMNVIFTVDELPAGGDYTLDISFLDETGTFETTTAAFLLRGVQESASDGEAAAETAAPEDPSATLTTETPEAVETAEPSETPADGNPASADELTAEPSETPADDTVPADEITAEPDEITETPEADPADGQAGQTTEPDAAEETPAAENAEGGDILPSEEPAAETETAAPPVVTKAVLRPEIRNSDGGALVYGSTVYVNEPYSLLMTFDRPLNDSVILEAALPASLTSAPIDPSSECMAYLNSDRTAWEFPGGLWNDGSFRCEVRFADSAWIAAQPLVFSLEEAPVPVPGITETFAMDKLSWTNYPVNITKHPATHQLMVSDSRGNLICSDNAACARFNAEDVYIMTYQFPASWGAALPSGLDLTASIVWPDAWASALSMSSDTALAGMYGTPCTVDWEGKSTLTLEETSAGRYTASCAFIPSGLTNPIQAAAKVHLNDNAFAVNDLNVWMPANIIKTEAVLTPSLTLRMTENAAAVEQIRAGTIGTLYRTSRSYPNTFDGYGAPALYTLKAEVSGISSARTPQFGDQVLVKWGLLDSLAQTGDLPSCLVPAGDGYALGTLEQTRDGNWLAQCEFRFPQTMDISTRESALEMQLLSGVYQTSARVQMNGAPFKKDTIYVGLDVPEHMLLGQPTDFHIRLSDGSGEFSEYLRAVLEAEGVTLNSSWIYNHLTTCGGNYAVGVDGTSECSVYFTQPVTESSDIHFDLITTAADYLFDVEYRPSADIHVLPITNIKAYLSVKLFHAGTEIPLPASDDDVFVVGDDYQLKFYLTPDPEFRDVLNAVSVDYEGMVLDWFEPLLIRWDAIPYGQTGLNFYRDGESFTASYDFSFAQGNLFLGENMGRLVMEPGISGWDIEIQGGLEPIRLPSRVERKPLSLEIGGFTASGSTDPVSDLYIDQEAEFEIRFDGSLDAFDPFQLMVGYDANGIHTPLSCTPDYSSGVLRCSITAQCTDYRTGTDYPAVCGTNLSLYAVYNGDAVNQAAEAAPKTFNVKRHELRMMPVTEGSISAEDVRTVQAVTADLNSMGTGTLSIGGWNVDTYIPRQIRTRTSQDYCTYPVIFRYEPLASGMPDEASMWLDVNITTGSRSDPREETISLRPKMLTDDTVMFEIDFGSFELLDDGRVVKDVLENVVEIRSLKARYTGSTMVSAASCVFESPKLEFALKVATLLEADLDLSFPGLMSFGGIFASEALMQPFDIHCSQLYQDMQCSTEAPAEIITYDFQPEPTEAPFITPEEGFFTETPAEEGSETGPAPEEFQSYMEFPETGAAALDFKDEGCWGKIRTPLFGSPQIYVNNAVAPVCYLTAWNENRQIWIAVTGEL